MTVELASFIRACQPDELAYWAGFFDGEGCVQIEHTQTRPMVYRLSVSVGQTQRAVLVAMAERFGGSVRNEPRSSRHKPAWRWQLSGPRAALFLGAVQPYLRVKARQAWLGREFLAQRRVYAPRRGHAGQVIPAEELALREGFRLAVQGANAA